MGKILRKVKKIWKWIRADRKRLIGAGLLLVLAVLVFRHGFGKKEEEAFQTARVEKGTIGSSISASGQILSSNIINISTQATGVVKNVFVENGTYVYAGQKLAEIILDYDGAVKNAQAYAGLVSAQNALNSANNNYRLTQASLEKAYDDLKDHDADETFAQKETRTKAEVANDNAYDATKTASVNLASAGLSYRQISPIITALYSGVVDNITAAPGMVISAPARLAVIRLIGNPMATFNVSEVDVNRVFPGQEVTITLDSIADKTFKGKVLTIDKIGTVSGGVTNYPVIVLIDSDASEILPNMAATADIILESKDNAFLVPSSAVMGVGEKSTARVLKDGQVKIVPVEVGITNDTQIEIVSGLTEGDEIVIGGTSSSSSSEGTSPFSTFRFGGTGGAVRIQH